jgi:hypothetical protein
LSNPLKYSTSTPTGALRHATLGAGVASAQYDENWNSGATPNTLTTYYLIYEPVNGTAVRVYAPANAAELIKLAQSKGSSETTEAGALTWLSANNYYPANKILENIVTDDLELYIDTRTATSYPRSGTDILDLSGEGKDGTLSNGVSFDEDSEALVFDGVDDYIEGSIPTQDATAATLEVWYKTSTDESFPGEIRVFFIGTSNAGWAQAGISLRLRDDKAAFAARKSSNDGYWDIFSGATVIDGRWKHLVGTFNTTALKRYENGILTQQIATGQNYLVGSTSYSLGGPNAYLDGSIAKARFYKKSLSQQEINQNYFQGPITTDYITYAFDASNLVSFEPGTTSVYSLTGSLGAASDGTLGNGVGFSDIANGNWVFDGVDDKLTLAANINLGNGNVAWTVEAWVKSTTGVNGLGQGSIASNDGSGPVYSMMGINANKMVYWTYQSGWVQYLGNKTINDGNWHHLTWVNYTNYTMDMYVDGVFDRNVGNSTSGNNNPIDTIGNSWSSRFDGDIASVYFYQGKSLSAAEVNQNYQAKIKKYT